MPNCSVLELAGSNVTTFEGSTALKDVLNDPMVAVRLERMMNSKPGLTDSGSHIIRAPPRLPTGRNGSRVKPSNVACLEADCLDPLGRVDAVSALLYSADED